MLQLIQTLLEKKMALYYFSNSGNNTIPQMEQVFTCVLNFSPFYAENEEYLSGPVYAFPFYQTGCLSKNETLLTNTSVADNEEVQSQPVVVPVIPQKKRRAQKSLEKYVISAKKNSESNLINQYYSFFSNREKSESIVKKCCRLLGKSLEQTEKILSLFFMTIKYINVKRGRKYVNASMLLKFFTPEEFSDYLGDYMQKLEHCEFVSLSQLCQIFRRCTVYFLKNISVCAILTSKRISVVSKQEHLKKLRKVLRSVAQI